ncbi:MAG: mechanosensitive ion channel family protein [Candidatus Obscuribacterales bacterium]
MKSASRFNPAFLLAAALACSFYLAGRAQDSNVNQSPVFLGPERPPARVQTEPVHETQAEAAKETESPAVEAADDTIEEPVSVTESEPEETEAVEEPEAETPVKSEVQAEEPRRIAQRVESKQERRRFAKRPSQKNLDDYIDDAKDWLISPGLQILFILGLSLFGVNAINLFSRNLLSLFLRNKEGSEIKKRADTMSSVVRYLMITVVIGVAGMMILKEIGIDIGPILAGAGVLGVAVGFGAQSFVKDVISGFFILFEDQIRVGDVVKIADKSGSVEKVTLRMVVLRDLHGNVHYIPSGEIGVVTNMTKNYSRYVFDISVSYKEDVDEVIEIMKEVDEDLRSDPEYADDILEPLEVMGLERFADSAVIVRARTMTRPIKQWGVGREFNRRLKKKFDERGIEIPYPQLTVSQKDEGVPATGVPQASYSPYLGSRK